MTGRLSFFLLVISTTAGTLGTLFAIAFAAYMVYHGHSFCFVVQWDGRPHQVCGSLP